jgi:hypothetical protein
MGKRCSYLVPLQRIDINRMVLPHPRELVRHSSKGEVDPIGKSDTRDQYDALHRNLRASFFLVDAHLSLSK